MSKKYGKSMESESQIEDSVSPSEEKVEFEVWLAERRSQIPAVHHKEVLKADFRGRGLSGVESMATFDEALEKYGVKLK